MAQLVGGYMNDLQHKAAEVQLGVLKLQHTLLKSQLKGDLAGHPFRGNQWSGGGAGGMAPDRDSGSGVAGGSESSEKPLPSPKTISIGQEKYTMVAQRGIGNKPGTEEPHEKYEIQHGGNTIGSIGSYTDSISIKPPGQRYATRHEQKTRWKVTMNEGHHRVRDEYNRDPETGVYRPKKGSHTEMGLKSKKAALDKMAELHREALTTTAPA